MKLTIPMLPPSANHYKKYRVVGRNVHWYLTAQAIAWREAVCMYAKGKQLPKTCYSVRITVFRGKGDRGDVDNYAKVVLDSLQKCGVLGNDDWVQELIIVKQRDIENPRTEIVISYAE